MKPALLFLFLLLSQNALADESVCLGGCPTGAPATNVIADHVIFRLSQNGETKFADWVAYVVTLDSKSGSQTRRNFKGDPLVPNADELETSDYTGAFEQIHINKGHQAPLASFSGSPHWFKTNYLTNITPQQNDLNKGAWLKLETAVRDLADWGYPVYVMTGPLYERPMDPLPRANEPHRVPSGYWKIIATFEEGEYWSAAFILDQATPRNASHCTHAVSVASVEQRTGLDFYSELGLNSEVEIETGNNNLLPWLNCP